MSIYDHSYFQDIFPEEKLKEYLKELEKVWNQNVKCVRGNKIVQWRKIMRWIRERRMKFNEV
jgi:hypothetical protein